MKPPLAWIQKVVTRPEDRKNRRWFRRIKGKGVMESAAALRALVQQFKQDCDDKKLAFASDREAWEWYKSENPGAHLAFIGPSADAALDSVAYQIFARYWRSAQHQQVHFQGDGTVTNAKALITVRNEEGTMRARTDPLELLFLEDEQDRALGAVTLHSTARKTRAKGEAFIKQAEYIEKIALAAENGAIATKNEITGEIIVQALLPGAGE